MFISPYYTGYAFTIQHTRYSPFETVLIHTTSRNRDDHPSVTRLYGLIVAHFQSLPRQAHVRPVAARYHAGRTPERYRATRGRRVQTCRRDHAPYTRSDRVQCRWASRLQLRPLDCTEGPKKGEDKRHSNHPSAWNAGLPSVVTAHEPKSLAGGGSRPLSLFGWRLECPGAPRG